MKKTYLTPHTVRVVLHTEGLIATSPTGVHDTVASEVDAPQLSGKTGWNSSDWADTDE